MSANPRSARSRRRPHAWKSGAGRWAGAILLLAGWEGLAASVFARSGIIPRPSQIVRQFFAVDGPGFYLASASHTLSTAAQGWLWGNLFAVACALSIVACPWLEQPVLQLGAVSYCLPMVAIGPVLAVIFSGETPRIILSAMAVFFVTLIGATLGLRDVDPRVLDAVHAFGGHGLAKLGKARSRAALPHLFAALRAGAPAAIVGSIVGEFLGADSGLGVVLINSQQGLNYTRTWTVAAFTTLAAGSAYGFLRLLGHCLTPWARETHANLAAETAERTAAAGDLPRLRMLGKVLLSTLSSVLVVLLAWVLMLKLCRISPFIGKDPADVWCFLTDPDTGATDRIALWSESLVSLRDTFIGLAAGTLAAVVAAVVFNLLPVLRRTLSGPVLALQSVPLIAMTPLIVLIFGRNLLAIAVIGGIITFFPTLVNVSLALERTPREALDLLKICGASRWSALWKVQMPHAVPSLFASMRIAAPLAITGALLAEWLATGQGLGYAMPAAQALSDYSGLWTRVALVTLCSLTLYKLIGFFERLVYRRMGVAGAR